MALQLYNSLAREKQIFEPINPDDIRVYACGPTVYNYAHIGNARMAVVFDLLVRVLRHLYPQVTYVSNITDVDDKIMAAARDSGEPINAITEKYTRIYNEDMAALGVSAPDIQPHATTHIGEMIDLIEKLVERDHAYAADGHVLFNVPSYPAYGGLSGRSRDEQIAGARVEVASYKKDAADFVLWKPSSEDEPGWESPWGRGRPGWHIECSAMAEKHLGLPFDIHGGGADLKFPHHENEIAQSCCAHGELHDQGGFARYWVHNGFVTVDGEKMSKSLGNFKLAHDLIEDFPGEALRLTLLSAHYRQPLDWSEDKIQQNKKTLDRLYKTVKDLADVADAPDATLGDEFLQALCDDLNTPKALSVLSALAKKAQETRAPQDKAALLQAGALLGVLQSDPDEWLGYAKGGASGDHSDIDALVAARHQAKQDKDWAKADALRDELSALNVVVEDTPEGPKWRFNA
ncbi:MAG: cysteine--tRNA ligase [Alphaproteobacteria bacterium]|nr:cysteine--tRNA ligase [Alphaproteobacteria bacterium]HCQ71095.1 cysteine--tRNA ligase [Rhodospirillaceae bacterium]